MAIFPPGVLELNDQGVLSLGSNNLVSVITPYKLCSIGTIRFYCVGATTITVQIYRASNASLNYVYEFNLDAGDTIIDTTLYKLYKDDILVVTTTASDTSYIVTGLFSNSQA